MHLDLLVEENSMFWLILSWSKTKINILIKNLVAVPQLNYEV